MKIALRFYLLSTFILCLILGVAKLYMGFGWLWVVSPMWITGANLWIIIILSMFIDTSNGNDDSRWL
jgi:hypothetical protein